MMLPSLDQIRPGDHICSSRRHYWHHAIVETVDISDGEVSVIGYSFSAKQFSQDNRISSSEQARSVIDAVKTGVNNVTDTLNTRLLLTVANSSPEQLRKNRPPEQMTTAENELSNQTFKKPRETKGVLSNTERNVAGDVNARTPRRALGTVQVRVSEIASRSYQTEGRLQNLSRKNADIAVIHKTVSIRVVIIICLPSHPNPQKIS